MTKVQDRTSVDAAEIEKFSAIAAEWWDPAGKFRPLHQLNPTRLGYIRDHVAAHFGKDPAANQPLAGLSILDIGCGGGLLSEPLTRLGARMTSIDAAEKNIGVASTHAAEAGLEIDYRHATAEDLAAKGENFDVVLNMEVIEHVADVNSFSQAACALVKDGGATVASTLNRTPKSYLMAILGAEYLLRWLPRGTHDWRKFLRPSELTSLLRAQGMKVEDISGVVYNPLNESWRLSRRDLDVNYMLFATKPKADLV
ncbi:bifunctional 2-polyprenyl-6-hydroxyphenol methylase/3-demethylubiquinol 3-O-methyltransferase UbiG [Pelagibius sp. Alg239-R121]|uniref:bifunctional 2-polyprenyl-6-hydroxyphenol methylase/3-demethylubiquinol 3-O-methyltransferase UbiG n=1 Tax=Pelagibius sp. Alg239-R121 TaxID=2993448 RepID=UPI0024A6AC16|nr:bifunctional 2-polyprenyl-6-hydroxyphenol methylase/3-demethylubiquinol 3-O-methyltransferase UbiG [Pelagibius sp. Alg239-R121]